MPDVSETLVDNHVAQHQHETYHECHEINKLLSMFTISRNQSTCWSRAAIIKASTTKASCPPSPLPGPEKFTRKRRPVSSKFDPQRPKIITSEEITVQLVDNAYDYVLVKLMHAEVIADMNDS